MADALVQDSPRGAGTTIQRLYCPPTEARPGTLTDLKTGQVQSIAQRDWLDPLRSHAGFLWCYSALPQAEQWGS